MHTKLTQGMHARDERCDASTTFRALLRGGMPYASAGVEANAHMHHSIEPLKSTFAHDSLFVKGNAQLVKRV
jgi:hypothetical protein